MLTKHQDNISMNMDLFKRVKHVYDQRESLGLTAIQIRVVYECVGIIFRACLQIITVVSISNFYFQKFFFCIAKHFAGSLIDVLDC